MRPRHEDRSSREGGADAADAVTLATVRFTGPAAAFPHTRTTTPSHLSRCVVAAAFLACTAAVASPAGGITDRLAGAPAPSAMASPAAAAGVVGATSSYAPPAPADFSDLSWSQAFRRLHRKLSREYAFTRWKGIDWRARYRTYAPRIARAQARDSRIAYYLALRAYIHELHDGHASMYPPDDAAIAKRIVGGGFGLTITRLDNRDVVVDWIKPGGPADRIGIKLGARIVTWQGVPVNRALRRTSTVLGPSQATRARTRYERLRFVVRARIGERRTVAYINPGKQRVEHARMRAHDDNTETLDRTDASSVLSRGWPRRMVVPRVLRGNIGYLRVNAEIDLPPDVPGDHTPTLTLFRRAIREFRAEGVRGIVLDVRANSGGSDQMVADMMASFYARRTLYEYASIFNPATGRFEIWLENEQTGTFTPGRGLFIKPTAPRFRGPVVALVDNACISSGEGLAMGVKNLPHGRVVGFTGTNGSFGMAGGAAVMPGGYEMHWPFGRSLDADRRVQLDSRHRRGGVLPDHRIAKTRNRMLRAAAGHDVVLHEGLKVLASMTSER